jgi:DNA topoisomerase-1
MLLRQSRFGPFLGCSNYPKCRTALKIKPDGTLQDNQEFKCTYSESGAKRNGAAKTTRARASGTTARRGTTRAAKPKAKE